VPNGSEQCGQHSGRIAPPPESAYAVRPACSRTFHKRACFRSCPDNCAGLASRDISFASVSSRPALFSSAAWAPRYALPSPASECPSDRSRSIHPLHNSLGFQSSTDNSGGGVRRLRAVVKKRQWWRILSIVRIVRSLGPFRTLPVAKCRVFGRKCRVDVGFFRETRHQFSKQNQSLRGKMSGMAGFSRMREVLRKRAAFFFVHGRGRPASTFGLQLDSKPRVRRGLVSVSL
jgi:hypothetical protein